MICTFRFQNSAAMKPASNWALMVASGRWCQIGTNEQTSSNASESSVFCAVPSIRRDREIPYTVRQWAGARDLRLGRDWSNSTINDHLMLDSQPHTCKNRILLKITDIVTNFSRISGDAAGTPSLAASSQRSG